MQVFMVEMPGVNMAMGCAGLSINQWILCIFIGATELMLNPFILMIPTKWLPKSLTGDQNPEGSLFMSVDIYLHTYTHTYAFTYI